MSYSYIIIVVVVVRRHRILNEDEYEMIINTGSKHARKSSDVIGLLYLT